MASIETIAKARIYSRALKRLLKEAPALDIKEDFVRLYYPEESLEAVQDQFRQLASREPKDIRIDFIPIITPEVITRYGAYFGFTFLAGLLIGGLISKG